MAEQKNIPSFIQKDIDAEKGGFKETFISPFLSEEINLPKGDMLEDPTLAEKAEQIAIGTAEGAVKGGTALGTGLTLGRIGAATLAPFGPYGAVAGGTLGFVGGLVLGGVGAETILEDVFPIPPREDLAPYREGGITFGTSLSAYPASFFLPIAGPTASRVSRYISDIGETARRAPIKTGISAFSTSAGSGILGGTAEAYAPGDPLIRFGAEVVGGLINPTNLFISGGEKTKDVVSGMMARFSPNAREYKAGSVLRAALEEASVEAKRGPLTEESLNKIIARLTAPDRVDPKTGEPIKLTAGQKTGIPVLNAIEASLAKRHGKYAGQNRAIGEKALQAYTLLIQRLEDIGDPQAFRQAATLRSERQKALLDARYEMAERDAAQKIAAISKDTPAARYEIGKIVKDEIDQSLKEARTVEKELWNQAYRASFTKKKFPVTDPATGGVQMVESLTPKKVDTQNLFLNYLDFASKATPERMKYNVPPAVQAMMKRIGIDDAMISNYQRGLLSPEYLETGVIPAKFLPNTKELDGLPVPDLINIRSDLLSFARDAANAGDASNASLFGRLAEASLDDLSALKLPAYDVARQYSRDLNDTFTRSFVGDLEATGRRGEKIPAELVVSRAFGSNADLTSLRMEQIEDAAGFMQQQYQQAVEQFGPRSRMALALKELVPTTNNRITSIRDAQARVMRLAASKFVDIQTGKINTNGLVAWAAQNKPALDRLGITPDLEDAEKAANAFSLVMKQNSAINTGLRKQAAFAQVLEFENPTKAVNAALNSKTPVGAFQRMAKLAASGGQDAIDGLKSTVYDYAFTQATNNKTGQFSPEVFERVFFGPLAPNQPAIYNILRTQGVMSVQEKNNLKRLLEPMKRVEESLRRGTSVDALVEGADPIVDLALRVIGARIGTAVSPGGPGSLIAAAAGSKAVRAVFDRMPQISITRLIEDATKDPQLMARLLAKGQLPQQQVANRRRLKGYLYAAGYNAVNPEDEPEPTAEEALVTPTTGPTAAQMLRQLPSGPPTRGVPGLMGQGTPPPSRSPKVSGPPATSQSRAMFQSLFPTDTISGLIGQPR